ncbi:dihydropteroate synthase [Gluconobacter oxydans]|uniref:dihydropteroate synthase n=1 Tax=Gluconobacter thailandicus TaxID=257438 RepID=UPI0002998E69|nr:dihydropteroate synthase [Gluconobacter thailandicus]AFW00108.1 dihydropteroate synthase [Gluconobacter oxydans H24]ANQ41099.1 dihydropteroate synthase [Gluconobacter oxydans]
MKQFFLSAPDGGASWLSKPHAAGRPVLMGILNVTPDSFSDGGRFQSPETAIAHAREMLADGADILDIGAESTRPGSRLVPADEEWARLEPVINRLAPEGMALSVDTTKAVVARKALQSGVRLINDVWGFHADPEMPSVIADSGAWAVVMHNRHEVDDQLDLLADWRRFFDHSLELAEKAGIDRNRLILDPGVGFGKTQDQNVQAIAALGTLKREYGRPILLGLSRKSMFGYLLGRPIEDRLAGTLAANLVGADLGADILRVHDTREHADALSIRCLLKENA